MYNYTKKENIMEKEIINLETSPKIGVIECLSEGITKFFTNFGSFFKMLLPIVYLCLGTTFLALMVFGASMLIVAGSLNYTILALFAIFAILVVILGVSVFGWAFWEYLIGLIAVSYLAKDIYENKPVQQTSDYYSYVKQHSKKYLNYWLVNALISLIWIGAFILMQAYIILEWANISPSVIITYVLLGVLYVLLTLPLVFGLSMSKYFWAYQDKEKPYQIIKRAILTTYKKFFPVLGFLFLLHIVIFAIEITLGIIFAPLSMFFSLIATYFAVFVTTRYYFDLIKD